PDADGDGSAGHPDRRRGNGQRRVRDPGRGLAAALVEAAAAPRRGGRDPDPRLSSLADPHRAGDTKVEVTDSRRAPARSPSNGKSRGRRGAAASTAPPEATIPPFARKIAARSSRPKSARSEPSCWAAPRKPAARSPAPSQRLTSCSDPG